jgi:hypothetical protein
MGKIADQKHPPTLYVYVIYGRSLIVIKMPRTVPILPVQTKLLLDLIPCIQQYSEMRNKLAMKRQE